MKEAGERRKVQVMRPRLDPRAGALANLEPGPSALRWLLGDDAADRAWGRVKITSQLIGYFEGKAVLPRIYFRTAGGHRAVAKLSLRWVAQV